MSRRQRRMVAFVDVMFEGYWYRSQICRPQDLEAVLDQEEIDHGRDTRVGYHLSSRKLGPTRFRPWEDPDRYSDEGLWRMEYGDGTYVLVDPLDLWARGTIANRERASEHE